MRGIPGPIHAAGHRHGLFLWSPRAGQSGYFSCRRPIPDPYLPLIERPSTLPGLPEYTHPLPVSHSLSCAAGFSQQTLSSSGKELERDPPLQSPGRWFGLQKALASLCLTWWGVGWPQGLFNILIKEFLPLKQARLDNGLHALASIFLLRQEPQFSGFLYFLPLKTSSWLFQLLKGPS